MITRLPVENTPAGHAANDDRNVSELLLNFLNNNLPHALNFLKELIDINSHTDNLPGVRANAELIFAWFAKLGFSKVPLPASEQAHLVLENNTHAPSLLLISHLDTVYTPQEQAASFTDCDISKEIISGPGALDIKGGTAMMWLILKTLSDLPTELAPKFHYTLAFNASEESLNPDFFITLKNLFKKKSLLATLVFEGDSSQDEKIQVVTHRSGMSCWRISAAGRSTHSGNAHSSGINAIVAIAELVPRIAALTDYTRGLTVNIGKISGGQSTNRVPHHAEILLEMRYKNAADARLVLDFLTSLERTNNPKESASIHVEMTKEIPLWATSTESTDLALIWQNAASRLGKSLSIGGRGGLSDANFFCSLSPTLDGLGPRGGNAHTLEVSESGMRITEYVIRESFLAKGLVNCLALMDLSSRDFRSRSRHN